MYLRNVSDNLSSNWNFLPIKFCVLTPSLNSIILPKTSGSNSGKLVSVVLSSVTKITKQQLYYAS